MASPPRSDLPEPLFPRLRSGPGQLTPERVASHQRRRLMGAMAEAVSRHGYNGVTIAELVALAGISKSTFYRHFEDKQDCFLATFEEVVGIAAERVGETYRSEQGLSERLTAGMKTLGRIVATEPAAAHLVLVDSLSLGAAAVPCREAAAARFEAMIAAGFAAEPERGTPSPLELRAIVAGIRRVAYRALRTGEPGGLLEAVPDLVEWALHYGRPAGREERASTTPRPSASLSEEIPWQEPPSSTRSRTELSQRERIVRAVAQLATEQGYASLSIPAISARAGTSNESFYASFRSKQEPFLVAFERLAERALGTAVRAFEAQEDWAEGVAAALAALLDHIAQEPIFARLAFFELPASGRVGLERSDLTLEAFTAYLHPQSFGADTPRQVPTVVLDAIGGGIWALIQYELAHGEAESLPELAPQLTRIALAPFELG